MKLNKILGEFIIRFKSSKKEDIFVRGVTSGERFKKNLRGYGRVVKNVDRLYVIIGLISTN